MGVLAARGEREMSPIVRCGKDVWQFLKRLSDWFENIKIEKIKKENWMQKLSYKGENRIQEKSILPKESVYKKYF